MNRKGSPGMASPAQQLLETTEAEVSSTRDSSSGWGGLWMSRALPLAQVSEKGSISLSSFEQKGKMEQIIQTPSCPGEKIGTSRFIQPKVDFLCRVPELRISPCWLCSGCTQGARMKMSAL